MLVVLYDTKLTLNLEFCIANYTTTLNTEQLKEFLIYQNDQRRRECDRQNKKIPHWKKYFYSQAFCGIRHIEKSSFLYRSKANDSVFGNIEQNRRCHAASIEGFFYLAQISEFRKSSKLRLFSLIRPDWDFINTTLYFNKIYG